MRREHDPRPQRAGCWLPAILIATGLITSPLWMGVALDAIPDRYMVAYAPEWLQHELFEVEAVEPPQVEPTPWPTLAPLPTMDWNALTIAPSVIPTTEVPLVTVFPTETPIPERVILPEAERVAQGWNNCGPATLATQLDYWRKELPRDAVGKIDQWPIADKLKPNPEDRNVTPDELKALAEAEYGLRGIWRYGGDIELLQRFIAAEFMPMVETGYNPDPEDIGWTSHFLNLRGYDLAARKFYAYDSYNNVWAEVGFDELESFWRQFNHRYLIFAPPERFEEVVGLIGEDMNDQMMYEHALAQAEAEIAINPNDGFAQFEKGTALVGLQRHEDAVAAYEQAQVLDLYNFQNGAWRMLWYQFGPYEAYLGAGRYDKVIEWADWVLANNEYSEEAFYWKGRAFLAMDNQDAATSQFLYALREHPDWQPAIDALAEIEN